ncbi:small GTP-binding protein Rab7, putative [Leishmania tarentolae]|uniref:Small GTP-binding protein Rab7, putative n=1 Tax=Leishmania tarentolae TaxID=5689 RepID=A0A640KBS8_LEITA|nr:small GTP-binding protein Rab7, putative [Leishmania tarentolae]
MEDLVYKIIVIGSVSVGKSNITSRFCDGAFYPDLVPTLGMDFKYRSCNTLEKNSRCVRLQVWDTSGQDDFVTLTTAFYRNCQGALLCFDLRTDSPSRILISGMSG